MKKRWLALVALILATLMLPAGSSFGLNGEDVSYWKLVRVLLRDAFWVR